MKTKKKRFSKKSKLLITVDIVLILLMTTFILCSLFAGHENVEAPQPTTEAAKVLPAFQPEKKLLTMGVGERLADCAYTSDNTAVADISAADNSLTAVAAGYATLSFGAKKCFLTVKNAPLNVTFRNTGITMQKGEQTPLILTAADDEGFSCAVYTSADSHIVSVTPDGKATAQAAGTTTVTATVYNGKSAAVTVQVLDDTGYTDKTTIADTELMADSAWSAPKAGSVPAGSSVRQYGTSADGRWCKVKFGDRYGWLYNRALEDITNYTDFTLETLPVMADDLIFETGTDKRAIFDYVYRIAYSTNEDDTTENLCVDYFTTCKGSCYTHAAMLCYLYNRCGYETLRLVGESAYEGAGEHSWCLTKTENGWLHYDAQFFTVREADEQFGVTDDTYYQWFHWDKTGVPAAEG